MTHSHTANEAAPVLRKPDLATDRPQVADPLLMQLSVALDLIIDDQSGWLCIGWIDGNPKTEPLHEEWFYVPTQHNQALNRLAALAETAGNIYARMCLFQKLLETSKRGDSWSLKGDYDHALPSRLIWKDDTGIDTPASVLIETSPGNYQALIVLDRPASTTERKHLMTAWRNSSGGDTCSADAVHFIRLPGGRNTKPVNNNHRVQIAMHSERIYSTEKLLARCGPISENTQHPASFSSDDWRDLPDGAALWQSPRWQALATRQRPQLKTLLIDRQPIALPNKRTQRTDDDSWSNQRAVFIKNTLEAYDPPPLAEIRAVAWYFRDYLGQRKTDLQYQNDIDRLIGEYLHQLYASKQREYQPQPTKYLQSRTSVAPRPRVARGRAGSHAALVRTVTDALIAIPKGEAIKMGEFARKLGMDRRTLSTILDELEECGIIIERRQAGQHRGLYIVLSGVIYSEQQSAISAVATPQTDQIPANAIESTSTKQDQVGVYSQYTQGDHSSQPAADLAMLVQEAIDAYGTRYVPGQSKPIDRVVAYVNANGAPTAPHSKIAAVYHECLQSRRWARSDEREAAKARTLTISALRRKSKQLATQAEAIESMCKTGVAMPDVLNYEHNGRSYVTHKPKQPTRRYAAWLRHRAGIYAAEEARRAPCESVLTPHELWAQVDMNAYHQARKELDISKFNPQRAQNEHSKVTENSAYNVPAMIERLRQLHKQANIWKE